MLLKNSELLNEQQKIYMSFLAQFLALSSFHLIEADL